MPLSCPMVLARFLALSTIASGLFATLGAWAIPAAEPDPVALRFEVFGFAGFHVLTNRTSVATSGDRYAIQMDLDTRGIASVFVDLTSHSEVRGSLTRDAVRPDAYHGDVRRNGSDRHYRMDNGADGAVAADTTPPSPALQNPAAANQIRGTVDQLTAFFILERQLALHSTCALVVPVFDGRNRYNIRFTDAGPETLAPDGRQHFSGPTQVCNVIHEDVPGFPTDQAEGTYRRGKIWYARLTGGNAQMVPVRMEFDTEFGKVEGYLAEMRGGGVDLHFMD